MNHPGKLKSPLRTTLTGLSATGIVAALLLAGVAHADQPGYLTTQRDNVVRSGFGECVHTRQWTPELRSVECGGQQAAAQPAPAPETETAAFEPQPQPIETLTLDAQTLFEFDKAVLREDARGTLDELAQRMQGRAHVLFVGITGHTDRIGDPGYNRDLSQRRAQAVADYLQNHTDLRDSRFQVQGMGEAQPVVACETASGNDLITCLQPNRRVDIEVSLQQPASGSAPQR